MKIRDILSKCDIRVEIHDSSYMIQDRLYGVI